MNTKRKPWIFRDEKESLECVGPLVDQAQHELQTMLDSMQRESSALAFLMRFNTNNTNRIVRLSNEPTLQNFSRLKDLIAQGDQVAAEILQRELSTQHIADISERVLEIITRSIMKIKQESKQGLAR